ncbi:MAG: heparinase II/III-family protein [Magnetospirillum sp. WYHS-4]
MIDALIRKVRQLRDDPVLATWLLGRALGRWPGEPTFVPHRPPYLEGLLPLGLETPAVSFPQIQSGDPSGTLDLDLPGERIRLEPGQTARLFERTYGDLETELAVHRFAWLNDATDPAWVHAVWRAWRERFGTRPDGWPWHPYTAAERAVALLAFARRHGLPGGEEVLAAHGPAIAARLEYFGEHHTSNHLFNNGRGLFLLGLGLGLPRCTEVGARIVVEEAKRIFRPSGVLREGSSHYHVLLARRLQEVADAATGRPEAAFLGEAARKAWSVVPHLRLPGGIALVGDISPDIRPDRLFRNLERAEPGDSTALAADGWLRADFGPWAGLWHAAAEGWSPMPGHGHQDLGSFELHFGTEPVFVDPGRGAYGETGEAARYRSASVHNTLLVDGWDPYPPNRPYYDATFRRRVGGLPPELRREGDTVVLRHSGFKRFNGMGASTRRWAFHDKAFFLSDTLEGRGRREISRRLVTPLAVEGQGTTLLLKGKEMTLRLTCGEAAWKTEPVTRWTAYGVGEPATLLIAETTAPLPWSGKIILEVL